MFTQASGASERRPPRAPNTPGSPAQMVTMRKRRISIVLWAIVAVTTLSGRAGAGVPGGRPWDDAATQSPAVPPPGGGQGGQNATTPTVPPLVQGRVMFCGQEIGPPSVLPPAGSGPVVYFIGLCFPQQGGVSVIEPETYLYYVHMKPSQPSAGVWVPWNDVTTPEALKEDFKRLWGTNFLDNLSIEVNDYVFSNGVVGKLIGYNLEERQRVKVVDYQGAKHLDQAKIDEKLKEEGAEIRLDTFIDPAMVRKTKKVLLDMLAEKGYQFASVDPEIRPVPGGPKLVDLTFQVDEGPQVKIRDVDFTGNKAVSSFALKRQMKNNKGRAFYSFITGSGSYQEGKFEEDADQIVAYYRDRGYIGARVGEPSLRYVEDSADRKTRWVILSVPIMEGQRYRVGNLSFQGNTVVKTEALRSLFKLAPGDWYSDKAIKKGYEKARELYGAAGYYQFNLVPITKPEGEEHPGGKGTESGQPSDEDDAKTHPDGRARPAGQAALEQLSTSTPPRPKAGAPKVDVVLQVDEGKQYFVNRIIFTGNSTTRDTVVRREIRLFENGIFNTEALKYSIKRINQLGYFKPLEGGKDVEVKEAPGFDNKMDVTLKFQEQNRNQIQFGAGVSQYEGFFGTLGFQTANFLGRGETLGLSLEAGSRAQNYQVSFTEPYLFDRAITGGIDVYRRRIDYISQFTQQSTGGNVVLGFPVKDFTRFFVNYSLERTQVLDLNPLYNDPQLANNNPYLAEALLLGAGGARTISKVVPSVVYNTIDNPISPTTGRRFTASVDLAGLGGDTNFWKPSVEGVWYLQQTRRTSFGFRGQLQYISQFTGSKALPITEKLALGGEYSVRGFDVRSIGPRALVTVPPTYQGYTFIPSSALGQVDLTPQQVESGIVVGGNKSLLFNAEYLISIAGPVRLVLFYDAGQVRDVGERFAMNQFKTSTGAEVRFFMPVLNVPFRLIFAYNPQRGGILDNSLQPQSKFAFKFAVGSTF